MGIQCVFNSTVSELMRGVRTHIDSLMGDIPKSVCLMLIDCHLHICLQKFSTMSLGLAHSLSRYKLKFSPDKVDTMIVQAICMFLFIILLYHQCLAILDDLDKEINNYVMRCREWYGWHFPEVNKLIQDHIAYVKTIKLMGMFCVLLRVSHVFVGTF
jgi:nucleolar protein 58